MADTFNIELKPTGSELTIRQGAALPLREPSREILNGTIAAPGDYWANRSSKLDPLECHIIAKYEQRKIILETGVHDPIFDQVCGALTLHPALEALTINAQKTYDRGALEKLIKFQGAYFESRDTHANLLGALKAFDAKIGISFKNADDYKGKAAIEKLTEITHNVPLQFKLAMPIFGGGDVETFGVEICVGLLSGGVDFWLESTLLHELIIEQTEAIFERELARFPGVVIIKQY